MHLCFECSCLNLDALEAGGSVCVVKFKLIQHVRNIMSVGVKQCVLLQLV
jgi:hypothetical protein